ncbi:MAG: cytochrome b5-like heme/steroid binding domain-containing protein [Actinomyces sp.]|uniref:cytochrome b5-like heme/steroid binding domain-containing protein n=1 Tax=Actinomyces sp. TaxID=29317 RepID=UPI0026DB3523|nr:cytochrome b5-like heme/steroid binding domain-containing protein [Actinomyces sp.]MDO4244072.1 cytochrome b5-like heme/steroid binding domain-containing protein [Actinomyces sp.]
MGLDLPLHPLVVHAPVVLLPLTTLGVIVLSLQRRRSPQLVYAVLGLLVVAVLATGASFLSGNALADLMGFEPERHERWGLALLGACVIYLLVGAPWLWRLAHEEDPPGSTSRQWGLATVAVASVVTVLTVLAGHSGAELAWSDVSASSQGDSASTPAASSALSASPTTDDSQASGATPTPSEDGSYTMEEVAQHASSESCWAVVNGNVYDLTDWISQHPGGQGAITGMCGTDATAAFEGEHAGEAEPAEALADYLLGPLG